MPKSSNPAAATPAPVSAQPDASRRAHAVLGAAAIATVFALGACAHHGASKRPNPALEKAGRLSLATAEETIAPAGDLAKTPITLPAASANPDWAQPGGRADNLNGHLAGPSNLSVAWRTGAGSGSKTSRRLFAPPIAAEGKIFVLDSDHVLRSFDEKTGAHAGLTVRFKAQLKSDKYAFGGGIAYGEGRIYAATGFGTVIAVDAKTGAQVWKRDFPAPFQTAPLYLDGRVYVITNDSELLALSAQTGANIWGNRAIAESARVLAASSAAGTASVILAPFPSGELVAYLPSNGRRLWSDALTRSGKFTPLSTINDIAGRPVIDNDLVFAASQSGVIVGIDLRTGDRKWEKAVGSIQTPAVVGNYVFVLTLDNQVLAMDRETGKIYWDAQLRRFEKEKKRKGRIAWTGPLVAGGRIYVVSAAGEVDALSPADGSVLESTKLKSPVYIAPFAVDGRVYVLTDSAKLVAIGR